MILETWRVFFSFLPSFTRWVSFFFAGLAPREQDRGEAPRTAHVLSVRRVAAHILLGLVFRRRGRRRYPMHSDGEGAVATPEVSSG